ncbi:MAG: glycosyltransferase, partial [Lachnospiraceae bacterium]|nr:glycosyltransferase [Lachnospiraceae bacterium]
MQIIKVSVIIPMLNAASHIKECLDSVIRQTLQEIEIWCVDAGSTDGTPNIVREYSETDIRIRLLESDRKSYGYQVNMGIDAAEGMYIGIVEPDDYIWEDMFEKLYNAARENHLDFVKSNFYKFMDYMGKRHYQKWERSAWGNKVSYGSVILLKDTPQALVYGDHGNIWSGIYRREFIANKWIRLHETLGASYQDTGFALLCSMEAERIMFLEDAFYYYRQDNVGSSVSSQEKHSTIIKEYQWIWEQMQARKLTDEVSRSFYMAMKFHSYLWNYNRLYSDSRQKFLENLVKDEILDFDETLVSFVIPEKDKMLA